MKKVSHFVIVNTIVFVITIIVNALANGLPFNSLTTGEVSDMYPNYFVPANITFAIWGVIYALLAAFVLYSIRAVLSKNMDTGFIEKIGPWFAVSCLANSLWMVAWHWNQLIFTLILMLLLLNSLIKMYENLGIAKNREVGSALRYCVYLPFSVYLGWITVATIANVSALLVSLNWTSPVISEQGWASIMICIAMLIGGVFVIRFKDFGYSLTILWALIGIWIKRGNTITTLSNDFIEVIIPITIVILAGMVISNYTIFSYKQVQR